jgi:hypothetical protein
MVTRNNLRVGIGQIDPEPLIATRPAWSCCVPSKGYRR